MISNLYLFTGENHYELQQELRRWKENFAQKYGAESIFVFTSENWDVGMIKQSLYGGGLFVSKKLVILDGIPLDMFKAKIEGEERILFKFNSEQYEKLTEEIMNTEVGIPDDTLLICISYKPDKRGRFYKFISKEGQVKEFSPLDASKAKSFIRQQADGLNLNEETVTSILEKVGTDQFCLVSEIEKLRFRKERNPETPLDSTIVDQICFGLLEADSFKVFDYLFKDPKKACSSIDEMHYGGNDWNKVLGLLYRGIKNYLLINDCLEHGISDSKAIASELKQNPFAIMTALKQKDAIKTHAAFLQEFFKKLIELDHAIKTGEVPDSYFWLAVKEQILKYH